MKYKIITVFCLLLFSIQSINADAIITYKSGKVIVFKGNLSCKNVVKMPEGASCKDGVIVLSNNGSWRKWIKKHYTPHNSYFKIKRGHVKIIEDKKTLYYKNWFFGKKHIIGNLEN